MLRPTLFRVGAVVLGLLVVFAGIELALRIVSRSLRSRAVIHPTTPIDNEVRVLFLGESTTACEWPGIVGTLLGDRHSERRFRIINRANPGQVTEYFSERISGWLAVDRPHVVVGMMGINDIGNVMAYRRTGARPGVIDSSLTFKLVYLMTRSAFGIGRPSADLDRLPPAGRDPATERAVNRLRERRSAARRAFQDDEAIRLDLRLIRTDPGNPIHHVADAHQTICWATEHDELDRYIVEVLDLDPLQSTPEDIRVRLNRWMIEHPDEFGGLRRLDTHLSRQGDHAARQSLLTDAATDSSYRGRACLRLARLYYLSDDATTGDRWLREAARRFADRPGLLLVAGELAFRVKSYVLVEELHRRFLETAVDPSFNTLRFVYSRLEAGCSMSDRPAEAESWRRHRDRLELSRFSAYTRHHYGEVVDAVRSHGAAFVAVQYPTLTIEPLRKLLDYREDVVYLENHDDFSAALEEHGYYELFYDSFAGGFGHFTERGNLMLASNVADVVDRLLIAEAQSDTAESREP